jgi:hypothetical protein
LVKLPSSVKGNALIWEWLEVGSAKLAAAAIMPVRMNLADAVRRVALEDWV